MITLLLYGTLKKMCGKHHTINKSCKFIEVLSYLTSNFPSSKKILNKQSRDLLAVIHNGKSLSQNEIVSLIIFKGDTLKLITIPEGRGDNWNTVLSVIIVIIGIILIIVSEGTYGYDWVQYGMTAEGVASAGWAMAVAGAAMLVSGLMVAQISPSNYDNQLKEAALKKSYGWGGSALNLTKSGNPVPLGYGTMRVGSQVISGGLRAENI